MHCEIDDCGFFAEDYNGHALYVKVFVADGEESGVAKSEAHLCVPESVYLTTLFPVSFWMGFGNAKVLSDDGTYGGVFVTIVPGTVNVNEMAFDMACR